MAKNTLIVFAISLVSLIANGQENLKPSCATPTQTNELFWCLVNNSPGVRLQKADIQIHTDGVSAASQYANPELEIESIDNKDGGLTSEISLMQKFELGGKRSARKSIARLEKSLSESQLLGQKEEAARSFALQLHRLRQIDSEIDLANENLETFKNIQKQYRRQGKLTPEQAVSASVFEIAEQETLLKKNSLSLEGSQILATIKSILGTSFTLEKTLLPQLKRDWPKLAIDTLKGSKKEILLKKMSLAQAQSELANSESWPDLSIGPKVEHQTGNVNETKFGIALSLPLPILSLNGAGRAKARSQLHKAELSKKLSMEKLERQKEYLINAYGSSSQSVEQALKKANVQKRHHNLHKLLNRGIIDSSLVIEMHREVFEFFERLHEHELKAIDAQWRLYALKGTFEQENLK